MAMVSRSPKPIGMSPKTYMNLSGKHHIEKYLGGLGRSVEKETWGLEKAESCIEFQKMNKN